MEGDDGATTSRLAVLTAIAAGPVALCVAVASTPTTVMAAPASKPTAVRTASAADPGGYAQLFLGVWSRSSAGDATTAQARLAQSMAPDVELPTRLGCAVGAGVCDDGAQWRGAGRDRADGGRAAGALQGSSASMHSSKIRVFRSCLLPVQAGALAVIRSSPAMMKYPLTRK
ncbi:hypothetical protein ABZ904_50700 [Streptomyces sp. NPDC046900]|uniref:hypothetical protein n=1 Tax=Streptomyces sp. NPDC046900 TaxID=3155473 RepID=UPI0033D7878B